MIYLEFFYICYVALIFNKKKNYHLHCIVGQVLLLGQFTVSQYTNYHITVVPNTTGQKTEDHVKVTPFFGLKFFKFSGPL